MVFIRTTKIRFALKPFNIPAMLFLKKWFGLIKQLVQHIFGIKKTHSPIFD